MTVVIGPHNSLSGFEGVIQFRTIIRALPDNATHPVQPGQPGGRPAADRIESPIRIRRMIDTPAMIRPLLGSAPGWLPP